MSNLTPQHISVLRQVVEQAQGADMDVGLSVNVLAALLDDREALLSTIKLADSYFKLLDDDAQPIDDRWIALAAHEAKQAIWAALAQAGAQ